MLLLKHLDFVRMSLSSCWNYVGSNSHPNKVRDVFLQKLLDDVSEDEVERMADTLLATYEALCDYREQQDLGWERP